MEPPHINIIVVYPVEFIGDPVLEENIPKMLSVVREYIKEYESYLTFKTKIGNTVWDSEKLKYGNIAYEHQERADKLAENYETIMNAIIKAKPAAAKGQYIKSVSVTTTMGPGIFINQK